MKLSTTTCAALVAFQSIGTAVAGGEGWSTDFEAARKKAAEEKKDILIDFDGSDWPGENVKLNDEVFAKDEFKKTAKDKFVLVEIDLPQDETKLTEAVRKKNEDLQEKFEIEMPPTVVLCDAAGKPFAVSAGYKSEGATKYLSHLEEMRAKKGKRDAAFAAADKLEGLEKARKLASALKETGLSDSAVPAFYPDEVAKIKAADPKDETGFVKSIDARDKLAKFEEDLDAFADRQDHEGALAFVEKNLKEGGFEGDAKQHIMITKAMIYAHIKKYDEALKAIDEAKSFAPDSEQAKQLDKVKERLVQMKNGKDPDEEEETEPEKK